MKERKYMDVEFNLTKHRVKWWKFWYGELLSFLSVLLKLSYQARLDILSLHIPLKEAYRYAAEGPTDSNTYYSWNKILSYWERSAAKDLPMLEERSTREGMITTFKFLSGFYDANREEFFVKERNRLISI